jgi:uncharacterized protein YutE (UPF0331/DUF86 family)
MTADEVLAKAQLVRQNLGELDHIPQGSLAEFNADARNLQASLHLLQTSIQALVDIGSFLCAKLGLPTPRSSHDVFVQLESDHRLPKGTADRFAPMIGFRNRVVHLYDRIDPTRVYEILTQHPGDFADCLRLLLALETD